MTADLDLDFAPIAKRIRESVGRQGFMIHVGAELSELARGSCTLAVDRLGTGTEAFGACAVPAASGG